MIFWSANRADDTFGYAKKERPYENEDGNLQSVLGECSAFLLYLIRGR